MKPNYLITGFLAVVFFTTGHFFMAAYTDHRISQSRLAVLRAQERSVKRQITEYHEKLKQLDQVAAFVTNAGNLGFLPDQWDLFFVDLKAEPMSYLKLESILNQTQNTSHYFFKPGKLSIQTGNPVSDKTAATNQTKPISQLNEAVQSVTGTLPPKLDVTLSLEGRFLVRRRGSE